MKDTQPALIIGEGVFESFNAAVNNKPDGCAHQSNANQVHNVGPKHEHFNASFVFIRLKFGSFETSQITLLCIIRQ
jgi:hypothetical protein